LIVRKVVLTYLILAAVYPCLAKNAGGSGEPVPVSIEQTEKAPDTISQNKGLELYSSYYQKNAGQVEVYYDSIEDGKLVGGKVLLALPPVLEYQSNDQAPLAPPSWSYETIIDSGPSENRIDIVVVGDGYTQSELNKYQLNVNSILGGYFAQQPLASYINFFNVHRVDVISSESGVDEPDYGIYRNTALDMTYNCAGISRLLCVNTAKAWDAASVAPDADQILALANSTRYGGAGYNNLATMAGDNSYSVELALHEFGHSFGMLADEYEYGEGDTYTGPEPSSINISIYSAQQQTNLQTKWYRWLNLPNVDTYEGAYYYLHGIYRPTSNSKMRSLNRPFEEVNVEQIIFRIYENVSIIDGSTPLSEEPVSCYTDFYVIPVEPTPNTISIQWRIDGQLVPDANAKTFSPDISTLTIGLHEISVKVTDNTSMVRNEIKRAQLMTKSLQWQIDVTKYSGGTGEPNNPYQIAHVADLMRLANDANDYNKCFILTADIDLDPNLPGRQIFTTAVIARDINNKNTLFDGNAFTGIFDGNGNIISNAVINQPDSNYIGLFGFVGSGGKLRNLGIENVNITGRNFVGGLVGRNDSNISNCYSTGSVSGGSGSSNVGGLVGQSIDGSISNCYSTGTVSGSSYSSNVGGLVGYNMRYNYGGNISDCYSAGAVSGYSAVGGLVGAHDNGSIGNCYSTGTVSGYSGSWEVGGLVGESYNSSISNCYSTGTVSGSSRVGGLLGYNNGGNISSSYFLITSGLDDGNGVPLTDEQMKHPSSFVGWDFVWETANGPNDIWAICEGVSYPKLAWQFVVGDSDNDKDIDFIDFAFMGNKWMQADSNLYCGGTDLTGDGIVDMLDIAVFAENWLTDL
jgi:hypothetical protein